MVKATKYDVVTWIKTIPTGEFHYKEVLNGQVDPSSYGNLRKIMSEMCNPKDDTEPSIEPVGRRDGYYRVIDDLPQPLDLRGNRNRMDSGIILPFDLRKYIFLYPDTTMVVAGSKSSGKTGFLYRTIVLNMQRMNTILLTNLEGGLNMLRDRFKAMGVDLNTAPFTAYPVYDNFHDFIKKPNTLYVIDYIDAPEGTDFYLIGAQVKKIDNKLQGLNSEAIIGLQKPTFRDIAFGGEQTLKPVSLYLAMDSHSLKVVDAKVPADKKIHPKNMQWSFIYDEEGTNFINIQRKAD